MLKKISALEAAGDLNSHHEAELCPRGWGPLLLSYHALGSPDATG